MEKKKLHRIVGILIFVAVVIIVLPLVTSKNGPMDKTLSVEAPPFPISESDSNNILPVADQSPITPSPVEEPPSAKELPQALSPPSDTPPGESAQSGSQSTAADQPPAVNPPSAVSEPAATSATPPATPSQPEKISAVTPAASPASEISLVQPATSKKPVPRTVASAWAIQMGNFHNHGNAIRLANRLRTAGYNAFTRQVVSKTGTVSTRVYVGPEAVQASARKLSADIRAQLSLDGMVVPFEPLAL